MYRDVEITDEDRGLERNNCTICGKRDMVRPRLFVNRCLSKGMEYHANDLIFPPPIPLPTEK